MKEVKEEVIPEPFLMDRVLILCGKYAYFRLRKQLGEEGAKKEVRMKELMRKEATYVCQTLHLNCQSDAPTVSKNQVV